MASHAHLAKRAIPAPPSVSVDLTSDNTAGVIESEKKGAGMGKAAEIYTYPPDAQTPKATEARRNCLCRFRGPGLECEQKNNRGQVALFKLEKYADLQGQYQRPTIPLGICSVMDRERPWIVCPNRLFYTGPASAVL